MNRKQRRAIEKKAGKKNSQNLAEKISQFEQLPDECLACLKPFDKKSKEMARTWNIVVPPDKTIRLYCPECWSTAQNIIEEFKERITNRDQ